MHITTFLMFTGAAEEAMSLYVSLFPDSRGISLDRSAKDEPRQGRVGHLALRGLRQP